MVTFCTSGVQLWNIELVVVTMAVGSHKLVIRVRKVLQL